MNNPDQEIAKALYKSISAANEDRVFTNWHASSIAECPRSHYFKRLGIKGLNQPTGAKILRWGAGHNIEQAIRPHIEKMFKNVVPNVRMTSKKLSLTGEYDNYSEEEATLIEIKSVSDFAFYEKNGVTGLKENIGNWENGNKRWAIKETPYLHHELQQHSYKLLLDELKKPLKRIIYIYISLNGRIVAYDTKPRQAFTDNVLARLKVLNEAWEKQEPPACICVPNHPLYDGVMRFCDYAQEGKPCCDLELIKWKLANE